MAQSLNALPQLIRRPWQHCARGWLDSARGYCSVSGQDSADDLRLPCGVRWLRTPHRPQATAGGLRRRMKDVLVVVAWAVGPAPPNAADHREIRIRGPSLTPGRFLHRRNPDPQGDFHSRARTRFPEFGPLLVHRVSAAAPLECHGCRRGRAWMSAAGRWLLTLSSRRPVPIRPGFQPVLPLRGSGTGTDRSAVGTRRSGGLSQPWPVVRASVSVMAAWSVRPCCLGA